MSMTSDETVSDGFSKAERDAMKQRARNCVLNEAGVRRPTSAPSMRSRRCPTDDRVIAERIHAIVTRVAPEFLARTWCGMPAYADRKDVVCLFQCAAKFDARYARALRGCGISADIG